MDILTAFLPPGADGFVVAYGGVIDHPPQAAGEEYARGQKETPGTIGPDGVFLSGAAGWYPLVEGAGLVTFRLDARLPAGWSAVTQGERGEGGGALEGALWICEEPQEEIFLVAGRYVEYTRRVGAVEAAVLLRAPDEPLARRYLDAAARYLPVYETLLGPYPYRRFAVVENFWETGYGMPSFTLLGPAVLRLPFLADTSLPHELVHSWYGNAVFVDGEEGNWSEGLAAYLADHLVKEARGEGADYRLAALQKYADYAGTGGRDMALGSFRSRHGAVTEAVGYGKGLFLFHMLRLRLGDERFTQGLRLLYRTGRGRRVGFAGVRRAFEEAGGIDLGSFFEAWVGRPGAARLAVRVSQVAPEGAGFRLRAVLSQVQAEDPFPLRVPLAVTLEGRREAVRATVDLDRREAAVDLLLPARPLRLDVDPEYDLFRRLDRAEGPPALSRALGAARTLVLLPGRADAGRREGWRRFAEVLAGAGPGRVEIARDDDYRELPADRSVVLLGWENRFLGAFEEGLALFGGSLADGAFRAGGVALPRAGRAFVATVRHPANADEVLTWVAADDPAALRAVGRKLAHYHKYSYLVFEGVRAVNVYKGRWPPSGSSLAVVLPPGGSGRDAPAMGVLPGRRALAEPPPPRSAPFMKEVVEYLAAPEMKGRGFGTSELDRASEYIAAQFAEAGLLPGGGAPQGWFQEVPARGGDPEREAIVRNVIGVVPGSAPGLSGEIVVVGAHYDHLGAGRPTAGGAPGVVHPGADDNASGVAVLLALARALGRSSPLPRTVVLAAFSGEEAGRLGSRAYVKAAARSPAGRVVAMINLDTVGRLRKELLALGAGSAREWPEILRRAGGAAGVEVTPVVREEGAGDHTSFLEAGIPAVQLFTGPHADYHRPTDTPDRVDAEGLERVAAVAGALVRDLASRPGPLTPSEGVRRRGLSLAGPGGIGGASARKVFVGLVPDFAHSGPGVRLAGTAAGSPAARAGLEEGDIVVRVGGVPVDSLADLSRALAACASGRPVTIIYLRAGEERAARVVPEAR